MALAIVLILIWNKRRDRTQYEKRPQVRNWVCRINRWLEPRVEGFSLFLRETVAMEILTIAAAVFCGFAWVWQWHSVVNNPNMGTTLRMLSALSNPLALTFSVALLYSALLLPVYLAIRRGLHERVRVYFGDEALAALRRIDYAAFQSLADDRLAELARAFAGASTGGAQAQILGARRQFWSAHNTVWGLNFSTRPTMGDYLRVS
ncbi:MAG: hypothetical protein UY76_C0048G0004 [Candidatus Uhrbacteria bacterium GW2011_GWA2_52_8d]|uniref:Uncharacterized protein n=1 Tax=Candidatus Uhrbacteria bacterium GW2011_GWA2_52_8d TaxID=1618979 RepID=A0A0G1XLU1_9BACT|nr:MAG: hypothetical protein UY76_C0048G0004 [Candidatus Uhrbacteria bacterium GW2011_GWA2_52_8d]